MMKIILDLDQVVRDMNLPADAFEKWKAANLDSQEGGEVRWIAREDISLLGNTYSEDLKTG